jgi:hypothetical protein
MENQIISMSSVSPVSVLAPLPRIAINIRVATVADISFIDALQKKHTKMVGWMPTMQLQGKIEKGQTLIAEDETNQRVGYCIAQDQYFKRDDVGIIYQMNVVPGKQRGLIGASLLKAQFERSAYGCKLYCCWCAQDIAANHFWESLGFVALAFRTGSANKSRIHIFWQKRIRSGDETTPYWFPSQTSSGAIREDRLVLPIPPGTSWRDAKPLVLPGEPIGGNQLEDQNAKAEVKRQKSERKRKEKTPVLKESVVASGGLRFGAPAKELVVAEKVEEKPKKEPKVKNDPKLVAAARELRDRWLEKANEDPSALLANGKYDVSRQLAAPEPMEILQLPEPIAA